MTDLEPHFAERASKLAPTNAQTSAAARSHNHLRAVLATGNMEVRIANSYLSGSYARHTAIRPLDDVDVIFEIDPSHWPRTVLQSLFSTLPSPDRVLQTFGNAIRYRYPSSSVRTQRRSVGLVMEHLHIDVVPAVAHEHKHGWLYVPDRIDGQWITSAPSVHESFTTQVNALCAGKFKPATRLLKGWNGSLPSTANLKSFAVESIAARVLASGPRSTLTEAVLSVLDFVAWRGGAPSIFSSRETLGIDLVGWGGARLDDVGGTGANILAGMERERLEKFATSARVARDAILAAARARDPQSGWRRIEPRFRGGLERL